MAYAVLAGVSFGVFLVLLAQTSRASGLWPLVGARCASLSLLVGLALVRRESLRLDRAAARLAVLAGLLDMASNVLFLVAVRGGQLALVGLLASLSPLGTVVLARLVLPRAAPGDPGPRRGAGHGQRSCCSRWPELRS